MNFATRVKSLRFLNTKFAKTNEDPYTLLVLNNDRPICPLYDFLVGHANKIVCVDGGANYHFHYLQKKTKAPELKIPDFVIGDLDSAREDVLEYFKSKRSSIIQEVCQNTNDLEKAFMHIVKLQNSVSSESEAADWKRLIIWSGLGRLDHLMFNKKVQPQRNADIRQEI